MTQIAIQIKGKMSKHRPLEHRLTELGHLYVHLQSVDGKPVVAMKATLEVQQEVLLSVCLCMHTICSLIAQSLNTDCKEFAHILQFINSLSVTKSNCS